MSCEANKAAALEEFDVWSTGAVERLAELVAPDVIHHDPYDPHASGGLEGLKRSIAETRQRFPDFRIAVEDQVAEGDRVVTRWRAHLTHKGKPVTMDGMTIERFSDGRVVESWRSMDMLGLLNELRGVAAESKRASSSTERSHESRNLIGQSDT